jgi:hypothetical protein
MLDAAAEQAGITSGAAGVDAPGGAQAGIISAPGIGGAVRVEVILQNAPPGTKVRTKTSGPLAVNTKVGYSMPSAAV